MTAPFGGLLVNRSPTAHNEGPSPHRNAATLEFRGVTKRYAGAARPALDDLSLEVGAGEICVLVGPSGCGKTTAMRLVNRLIEPTSGDILLGGTSVMGRPPAELRREIGYVIQQVGLFPHLTVGQNVGTVPRLLGWDRKRIAERVEELLQLVSLDPGELRDRYPNDLSGGQRQRVGVARALAADPPLMLMDEPFGAIDPIARERLQDEFLRLQEQVRKTVVFVTHDIDEAIKMGDRIAIMRQGGVLAQYATPEEILTRPVDDFVAQFVGSDRALKRLGLTRLNELQLLDPKDAPVNGRSIASTASARDALAIMLTAGGRALTVVDPDGRRTGVVTIDLVSGLLAGSHVDPGPVEHETA
jgi:osmoprotectant transport system ATP-binding protein